jgi:hypothetical protein
MRGIVLAQTGLPQAYHDALYLSTLTNTRYRDDYLTDDVRIHQYYGGANAQSINPKRQYSHDQYSNTILQNGRNLTYAPVFSCSNGITRNGVRDLGVCDDKKQS